MSVNNSNKWRDLVLSLLFDGIGMISYFIPGFGEMSDIIWAPIAAFLNYKMYKESTGAVGSFITLAEEAIPGTDIIPTFTLTWVYTYLLRKSVKKEHDTSEFQEITK